MFANSTWSCSGYLADRRVSIITSLPLAKCFWAWCCDVLQWRHNDHDGVSNHKPHGCLLNHLFRRRSKKTSKSSASLAFVWGIRDRWIPRTKGQLRGKCFHLMTSSWARMGPVKEDKPYNSDGIAFLFLPKNSVLHDFIANWLRPSDAYMPQ